MTAARGTDERPLLFDRVSVLPGRLEYALAPASALSVNPVWSTRDELFLCIDNDFVYARFFADFGPLNLGQTVRFCQEIDKKLLEEAQAAKSQKPNRLEPRIVVLVSSDHPHKRANTMSLLVLYLVMSHHQSPEQAMTPFKSLSVPFGFRDAACGVCSYFITILDCARAVHNVWLTCVPGQTSIYELLLKAEANPSVCGGTLCINIGDPDRSLATRELLAGRLRAL